MPDVQVDGPLFYVLVMPFHELADHEINPDLCRFINVTLELELLIFVPEPADSLAIQIERESECRLLPTKRDGHIRWVHRVRSLPEIVCMVFRHQQSPVTFNHCSAP